MPADALPPASSPRDLRRVLAERFRLPSFRPHQERICEAITAGRDALVVMPTGAGKSLCYQLPAAARGGTALVVSPLIALMEDQVQKLLALGFRAACIHSGRDRADSRAACRAYLDGELDYLFIAPERLKVPRFPEMLEKRPLALVAVDEAHCISHWGHDFRPEYRVLGERVARFRPAPIVALTATATPRVQADIVAQLHVDQAARYVSGFRRDNLRVEVAEVTRTRRTEAVAELLAEPARRPAIVYVPTRKETAEVAGALADRMKAHAYHAGMPAAQRDAVQKGFSRGEIEVVVATIAFGMGIDKADVRTVVHTALPSSIEGYYQEIGRAGRDGAESHVVLLHSYADQRLLRYHHDRSYPEPSVLEAVAGALGPEPLTLEELQGAVDLEPEQVERGLELLWLHGGAKNDGPDTFVPGARDFQPSYRAQRAHHEEQIRLVARYAEVPMCRMQQLTRHFGEETAPCGRCDVCDPAGSLLGAGAEADPRQRALCERVLAELASQPGATLGQLARALDGTARGQLDDAVAALSRAGEVRLEQDSFEKDGRTIEFHRVFPTGAGGGALLFQARQPAKRNPARFTPEHKAARRERRREQREARDEAVRQSPGLAQRIEGLRAWRRAEAERRGFPAFRIFSDSVLMAIAAAEPGSLGELAQVRGIGAQTLQRYGEDILRALR